MSEHALKIRAQLVALEQTINRAVREMDQMLDAPDDAIQAISAAMAVSEIHSRYDLLVAVQQAAAQSVLQDILGRSQEQNSDDTGVVVPFPGTVH